MTSSKAAIETRVKIENYLMDVLKRPLAGFESAEIETMIDDVLAEEQAATIERLQLAGKETK